MFVCSKSEQFFLEMGVKFGRNDLYFFAQLRFLRSAAQRFLQKSPNLVEIMALHPARTPPLIKLVLGVAKQLIIE